ncbi:hypothetical protein CYMTET_45522 [Cymbomonas tetramitiformis]|uniref:Uncharacterized protein n=1 Tax=Cymbomonas tetramitiformis TaxID=36881 RepID=A0AAE0BY33_9CHLO|nr:hypothetical protein CYMTET_45522 [Cymbomonas tetramitiformis]
MYSTEGDEESDGEDELGDEEEEADEADEAEEAEDGIQEGDERVPGGFLRELKPGLSYGRNARLKRNEVLFCADKETQKRISDLVIANHNQRYFKRREQETPTRAMSAMSPRRDRSGDNSLSGQHPLGEPIDGSVVVIGAAEAEPV